ncbi:MAG: hypothetical protein ACYTHK_11605 [Planctomycetota bacterium]
MLRPCSVFTLLLPLFVACSGGGGGSSGDAQEPPPTAFAVLRETGLEIGNSFPDLAVIGRVAVVGVSEPEAGQDLNGDGDTDDLVAHQVDVDSLASLNLGIAIRGRVHASDSQFAFLSLEADQGGDLNGDGDGADAVWHVYDPATALSATNPLNLGLATPPPGRPCVGLEGGFVMIVSEAAQGAPLNGDSDMQDDIAFAFSGLALAAVPLPAPPHAKGTPLVAQGSRALFCGSEFDILSDFNGDGDVFDNVLGVIEFDASGTGLYRPVGGAGPRAVKQNAYTLAGDKAIYLVDEASAGAADLNRDGDSTDAVLAIFDLSTGLGEITPSVTSLGPFPLACSPTYGFAANSTRLVVGIDEATQGRDFNVDQDTADVILAWVDLENSPGTLHVPGHTLGTAKPAIAGELALVTVSEAASALVIGIDYNNDGDIGDEVAFALRMDSGPGTAVNLGFAAGAVTLRGTDGLLGVIEAAQSGTDFNGDADTNDIVPFYVDLSQPQPVPRSLGMASYEGLLARTPTEVRVALLVPEQPRTAREDVNGDGDSDDNAVFWVDLDAAGRIRAPTPYLAGIAGFVISPPLLLDPDTLVFATSERMADQDLNGDGDTEDTVLRISYRPPREE